MNWYFHWIIHLALWVKQNVDLDQKQQKINQKTFLTNKSLENFFNIWTALKSKYFSLFIQISKNVLFIYLVFQWFKWNFSVFFFFYQSLYYHYIIFQHVHSRVYVPILYECNIITLEVYLILLIPVCTAMTHKNVIRVRNLNEVQFWLNWRIVFIFVWILFVRTPSYMLFFCYSATVFYTFTITVLTSSFI